MSTASLAARPTRRRRSRWRSPIGLDTVSTLAVIGLLLQMPLMAIDRVGWAVDMAIVLPVMVFGVILGLILARSRFGEFTALMISLLYGVAAVMLVASANQRLPFREALASVINRCVEWAVDLFSGGINTDDLVLTMLVGILFWFLAYNANWHIFRLYRVWRVILPPGLVLLVNIVFFSGEAPLDRYLFGFLLFSLVLIVRSNLDARQWEWSIRGVSVPAIVRRQFAAIGLLMTLVALLFAWGAPSAGLEARLQDFQRFLATDPIQRAAEIWNRLFAPIEGEGPATSDYYGADLLTLGGAISLGEDVVFTVDAPPSASRIYWRSRVFERYSNGQWSPSADLRITDRSPPVAIEMNDEALGASRQRYEQRFTVGAASSRIYYAAPQPASIDSSGRIDLIYTDGADSAAMNVSVIRPLKVLRRGETYRATSMISVATATQLRRAARDYPAWVSSANLYVGNPNARVLELARRIEAEAKAENPYDSAKAIETWLRRHIEYSETISAPPPNVDIVEWILFDARQGYCTYYASAMIVMLRHLGIPARLAAGFSQGAYDAETGQFVVRERDAHTWVEVYFPGYGWVEFEPTSAEAPIQRDGDELAQEQEEPQQPEATETPSPSPTPPPSPTALPSEAAEEGNLNAPTVTPTPTALPSPSPTPFILPTVQPPISPDSPPPLSALQPILYFVMAVLVLLLVLAIIALLLFWWWEWRGMGGLSPVSRAYARLERYIQLIGINIGSTWTTLEKRRELQRRIPAAREPIQTISDLYTRERYGGNSDGVEGGRFAESAEQAWHMTRGNILRRWLRKRIPFLRRG